MKAKENALRIVRFDRPERVLSSYPAHGVAYRGANHEGYEGGGHHLPVGSRWTDIWGTGWHKEHAGVMGFPREHPLADLPRALDGYAWPDTDDERICGWIYEQAEGWDSEEELLHGSHRDTLWEKSYMLVGMQDLMCFFSPSRRPFASCCIGSWTFSSASRAITCRWGSRWWAWAMTWAHRRDCCSPRR